MAKRHLEMARREDHPRPHNHRSTELQRRLLKRLAVEAERIQVCVNAAKDAIASPRTPGDSVDAAQDGESRDVAAGLIGPSASELEQIAEARQRIEREGRPACGGCGKKIPLVRLQAIPYATLCVSCARKAESGTWQGGEEAARRSLTHAGVSEEERIQNEEEEERLEGEGMDSVLWHTGGER